jgi:hypothetical protein
MKVYVVEVGAYEEMYIEGIYATLEAAIAANPIPADYSYSVTPSAANTSRPGGWIKSDEGYWSNQLDWSNGKSITEYEVQGLP